MSDGASTGPVLVERGGPGGAVAGVTLARPEAMNALSRAMVAGLRAAVADLRADAAVRVLVITGAEGKAFCAGADLKERRTMSLDDTRAYLDALGGLCDDVAAFPRPVIASLNGIAFGGGLELALACDLRVAAEGIEVGLLETAVGIIPGAGGTQRLSRLCGVAAAKELILTARRIPIARAFALGIVNEVVPRDQLRATVDRWIADVVACAPVAVTQAKRAIDGGVGLPWREAAVLERTCYEVALTTEDRNEGLDAFAAKRKPVFTGK